MRARANLHGQLVVEVSKAEELRPEALVGSEGVHASGGTHHLELRAKGWVSRNVRPVLKRKALQAALELRQLGSDVRSLALRRSRAHRPVLRLQQSSAQAHRYALQRKQRTCKPWDACKPATPGRRRIASSTWREDPLRQLQQPRDSAGERGTKAGLELFDMCMMKFLCSLTERV